MKKRSAIALISLLMTLLATSCTNNTIDKQMSLAEELMTEKPDSALSIMNSIETKQLTGNRQRATYALLMAQTQFENRIGVNDSLLDSAVKYFERHGDKQNLLVSYLLRGRILSERGDYKSAITQYYNAESLVDEHTKDDVCGTLYSEIAKLYEDNLVFEKNQSAYYTTYQYFERSGDEGRSITIVSWNRQKGGRNGSFRLWLLVIFVGVVAVDFVVMLMKYRINQKNRDIERYVDLTDELSFKMKSSVAALFSHQYELLNALCNTYYDTVSCKKDKEAIYKQVKREMDRFSNDRKTMAELENIVNKSKHDVMKIVRQEFPDMKEPDLRFVCFVYADFSVKAISVFTGLTTTNIFTKKSRFKSKVKMLNNPNGAILLENLP